MNRRQSWVLVWTGEHSPSSLCLRHPKKLKKTARLPNVLLQPSNPMGHAGRRCSADSISVHFRCFSPYGCHCLTALFPNVDQILPNFRGLLRAGVFRSYVSGPRISTQCPQRSPPIAVQVLGDETGYQRLLQDVLEGNPENTGRPTDASRGPEDSPALPPQSA